MWEKIKSFFKDSEVIFWSRMQALLGLVAGLLTYVDPSIIQPLFGGNAQQFAIFLVINGFATEYLRRRRDSEMNKTL